MITGVNHITIAVRDLDRALSFYIDALSMRPHVRWNTGAYLSCGDLWFCLSCDQSQPADDYSHIAFSVSESDFHQCAARLLANGAVQWKENSSHGDSLYFLDPDGHKLEIHSGSLAQRLASLRSTPYDGLRWY